MDVGAAVIGPAACVAVDRWVACGRPPTHRVVTISGDGAREPGNFRVPLGAACEDLVGCDPSGPDRPGELILHGDPMTGVACDADTVVTAATNAVLRLAAPRPRWPQACIRCGWCVDRCPARLNVAALNDDFELDRVADARRRRAMACVDCGTCSYLCPSRLPLAQRIRQLKRAIAGVGRRR